MVVSAVLLFVMVLMVLLAYQGFAIAGVLGYVLFLMGAGGCLGTCYCIVHVWDAAIGPIKMEQLIDPQG
jgi:hypothetical protein